MADKFPTTWLKNWSAPSYDPNTGRSASAFGDGGSSTMDGERINPSSQREAGRTAGQNGAPGFAECDMNRSRK